MAGRFYFGKQEQVRCIRDVDIHGADDQPLCLAHKTTTHHFGAGVHLSDDGYVLGLRSGLQDHYYPLDAAEIRAHQNAGALPDPLPPYTIPFGDYVWGYLVWIVVALSIAWGALVRLRRARRRRLAESLLRGDGASHSTGPSFDKEGDRMVRDRVAPLLRAGERSLQHAYVTDRDADSAGLVGALFARGLYAVLTTERMLLLSAKNENGAPEVESIERETIRDLHVDGEALVLELADGTTRRLVIQLGARELSNQHAFARDVARHLARAA